MSLALLRRAATWVLLPRAARATGYLWVHTAVPNAGHADGVDAVLSAIAAALGPSGCAFGAAGADVLSRCAELGILVCAARIRAVVIEPTRCDRSCGGFRVLTGIGDRVALALPPYSPRLFRGADDLPISVLAVFYSADRSCRDLLRVAARLARTVS